MSSLYVINFNSEAMRWLHHRLRLVKDGIDGSLFLLFRYGWRFLDFVLRMFKGFKFSGFLVVVEGL